SEDVLNNHVNLSAESEVVYNYTISLFGLVNDVNSLPQSLRNKVTGFSTDGIRYHSEDLVKAFSTKKPTMVFDHSQLHEISGDFYVGSNLPNSFRTYSNECIAIFRTVMTGLEYGFSCFHIQHVSTLESLETISYLRKFAKISCELTPHHSFFTPDMINHPNQKINPPISKYRDELVKALKERIINCFATDHAPHPEKPLRYEDAPYGSSHIEVAFSVYLTVFSDIRLVLENLTQNPLHVLGKSYSDFGLQFPKDAVLIDPEAEYMVEASRFFSKGKNCAFDGYKLKGKILGVRKNGRWVYWNGEFIDE
ncbi:MAG: dihydroorotase, partial [Fervidobacterium sp.]|nr:dihydroorotase [Fervidobacterium sp.]